MPAIATATHPRTRLPPKAHAAEAFRQGQALFQGEFNRAIELLGKAVAADKTKTSYRLNLARAIAMPARTTRRRPTWKRCSRRRPITSRPGQALGDCTRGQALERRGPRARTALEVSPRLSHLSHAGRGPLQPRRPRKGPHDLRRGDELNPASASDHYQLGTSTWPAISSPWRRKPTKTPCGWAWTAPCCAISWARPFSICGNYFGNISSSRSRSGARARSTAPGTLSRPCPAAKTSFAAPRRLGDLPDRPGPGRRHRGPARHPRFEASIYLNARRYGQAYEMFTKIGPACRRRQGPVPLLLRPSGIRHRPIRPLFGAAG